MPNLITPKALAIIFLAFTGKEVAGFITQLPEQLLIEAQSRAVNFGIQYGAIAIGQCVVGSKYVNPIAPVELFVQGIEALNSASSPEEAATRGSIAAAVLILSSLASEDPNASLTFGGFLIVLAQNVLLPGSQLIFSKAFLKIYVIKNLLIRVITEIRIERKRRKMGLPRPRLKSNIFKNQEKKHFVFKYIRFKKRKIKILSRYISLPVPYQRELIIKQPEMVKLIRI